VLEVDGGHRHGAVEAQVHQLLVRAQTTLQRQVEGVEEAVLNRIDARQCSDHPGGQQIHEASMPSGEGPATADGHDHSVRSPLEPHEDLVRDDLRPSAWYALAALYVDAS
jgi:hypothetical protein